MSGPFERRAVVIARRQVDWLKSAADALDMLAALEDVVAVDGSSGALGAAYRVMFGSAEPSTTRATADELRAIADAWKTGVTASLPRDPRGVAAPLGSSGSEDA